MKWLWKLIPHRCPFLYTHPTGDSDAKFFMVRECPMCGKLQNKDLRLGGDWKDGDYVPKPEVEFIQLTRKHNRKGW